MDTNTNTNTDIFSLPPLVLQKVRLSEILELLRDRVNKGYMPGSHGTVQYNSKPRYTEIPNPQFPAFPDIWSLDASEYFCLQSHIPRAKDPIFFNLHIAQFQIVINLTTEQAIIRLIKEGSGPEHEFVEWKDCSEQTIPLMRDELKELIDIYG